MPCSLYRQAVSLIKLAQEQSVSQYQIPTQDKLVAQPAFYSDKNNSGVAVVPRGVIDRTNGMQMTTPAQWISKLWQYEQSKQDMDLRSGNNNAAWKNIRVPYKFQKLNDPDEETKEGFAATGLDFSDPKVQGLGNQPDVYFFNPFARTSYINGVDDNGEIYDRIHVRTYFPWSSDEAKAGSPATSTDWLTTLAHETAHRKALSSFASTTAARVNPNNALKFSTGKWEHSHLPWRGSYSNEWPSVINEWTYGHPETIHPKMVRDESGNVVPMRKMTASDEDTDTYYADMFPLADMKDLKSEFGKIYSYWHGPNEPDIPSDGKKRLVYETPSGYWVDQFGRYVQTGAQAFDPDQINFSDNINKAQVPSNLQRIMDNLSFLNQGQPTDERQAASEAARQEVRDLMARLGLHREFFDSNGKTYAELLNNTLAINDSLRSMGYSDADLRAYWTDPARANWLGRLVVGANNTSNTPFVDLSDLSDTEEYIRQHPMWDPNMVLEPIPIGLAGLQKKYSLTPTVDEPSDWRDVKQYEAIKRDAQHCYDLQDEINKYGPKDGGWGV